jgi:3-methyladenine DNA glycosylase AlkD
MKAEDIKKELEKFASKDKANLLSGFFKTGKGQYGEGDIFIGITVPNQRIVAKKYTDISLEELQKVITSKIHEHRLTSFIILTYKYPTNKEEIYNFYIKNKDYANNWDLVDVTTPKVVGAYLFDKDKSILHKLAKSKSLWDRRIAVLATFYFINQRQFEDSLKIAEILLNDHHDLIHKAVGWMLREIGKRDQKVEEAFLNKHYKKMPRTMLRYSIERFSPKRREFYMKK